MMANAYEPQIKRAQEKKQQQQRRTEVFAHKSSDKVEKSSLKNQRLTQ